ncbi:MAG: fimbrillin family protein [Prevotella sp.]|nr:fimbrillin family protein [Prevotella sp.]
MKTKQFYFEMLMAFVAMMFTACSSSDEIITEKGKALFLDASILRSEAMNVDTRCIQFDTDTVIADIMHTKELEIGVGEISRAPLDDTPTWSGNEGVTIQVGGKYYQYTIGGNGVSAVMTSSAPYYFTTLNPLTVNAWYPSTSGDVVGTACSVSASQNNDANFKNSDFMYGSGTVLHSNETNSISLSHKIAKICVTVNVNNPGYLNNSTINSVTLRGTKLSGTVGSNGALTATGSASDIVMHKKSTGVYEACIIPQSAVMTFLVNVGGTTYTATMTSRSYTANNIYTATVNINAAKYLTIGYSSGDNIAIGDFYGTYANGQGVVIDGTSSAVSTAKSKGITPSALIYTLTTSVTDKSHGWTTGYAWCIRETDNTYAWSTITNKTIMPRQWSMTDDPNEIVKDMDGYTYTSYVTKSGDFNSANYPAFFACVKFSEVAAGGGSSGWYMPTSGQIREFMINIGKGTTAYAYGAGKNTWCVNTSTATLTNNINTALSPIGSQYDAWGSTWTCLEANESTAVYQYFGTLCDFFAPKGNKANSSLKVRPMLAF